jgi:hypothetical protein
LVRQENPLVSTVSLVQAEENVAQGDVLVAAPENQYLAALSDVPAGGVEMGPFYS